MPEKRLTNSIWTEFLEEKQGMYDAYKDLIEYRLEGMIADIIKEMCTSFPEHKNKDDIKLVAVNTVMQQMLMIQRKNSPLAFKAMVIALFSDLPEIDEFRFELIQTATDKAIKNNSLWNKIKKLFKKTD